MNPNDTMGCVSPEDEPNVEQLRNPGAPETAPPEPLLPEATRRQLSELRARQSVLEWENAELRLAQAELTAARARQAELEAALQVAQMRLTALWGVAAVADAGVKQVADHILSALTTMTASPYGFYGFIHEDESVMTIHSWSGEAMAGCAIVDKPTDFPIRDTGVWGEAVRRREPLILNDYAATHSAKRGLPPGHVALDSLLVVPFFVRDQIVAVAAVANRPTPYTADDVTQITLFLNSVQAIVNNQRAEMALRASEEKYRIVADFTYDWEYWLGPEGQYLYLSPACERITGYAVAEFLADPTLLVRITHPEDRARVEAHMQAVQPQDDDHMLDFRILTRAGGERWISHRCQPVYDQAGNYLGQRGSNRDITEHQLSEAALQTSERRYRELVENISSGVAVYEVKDDGRDFVFVDFNRAAETLDHDRRERLLGQSIFEMRPGVEEFGLIEVLRRVWRTGVPAQHPVTFYQDDHLAGWYENYVYKLPSGEIVAVFDNITTRKQMEIALQESETRYRQLVELSPDLIVIHQQARVVFINPAGVRLLGASAPEEIVGHSIMEFVTAGRRDLARERMQQLPSMGKSLLYEQTLRRLDGVEFEAEVVGTRFEYQGQPAIQLVARDITERKEAARQIQHVLEEKDTLLRELFHRINNNMQIVLSMLQLQAATLHDPQALAAFRATQNRIRTMALVHQMLYSAQDLSSVNLRQYIMALTEWLFSNYRGNPDQIHLAVDATPIVVLFDVAIPCGFILNELISNALEHAFPDGRRGAIVIQLARTAPDELLLRVSDDGVGVPPDFDFRDAATLGLPIVFFTAEHQLQGQVTCQGQGGVTCEIRFKDTLYSRRV